MNLTSLHQPTILMVDDIPANIAIVVESLEAQGYRVVVAQDGAEGLQRARHVHPDLILLDVMMPDMDGFEVCRQIKSSQATRDIPVIFMTSLADTEDKLHGFAVGAVDYVTKPLNIQEVAARIQNHLHLHAMQKQLEMQNLQLQHYREGLEQQVMERTAALSASEQQFRTLAENLPDVVVRYDRALRRVFVNDAYLKANGVKREDVLGKGPSDFWRPVNMSAEEYAERLLGVMTSGSPDHILLEYSGDDGYPVSIAIHAVSEQAGNSQAFGVLTIGRDISLQVRHQRLEETRVEVFELLATGSPLSEVFARVEAYVAHMRPDFMPCVMLLSEDGKHLLPGRVQSLPLELTAALARVPLKEGIWACGAAALHRQSAIVDDLQSRPSSKAIGSVLKREELHSSWSEPVLDSQGQLIGTFDIYLNFIGSPTESDLALMQSVSQLLSVAIERKRASDLLWESERKYRTLVEDSPDIFVRYDLECRRVYVSDAFEHVFGMPASQVLGKTPTEVWGAFRMPADEFESRLHQVIETGQRAEIEIDWYTKEGEYTCLSMRAVPEYDREGRIVSVLSITRDISEAKRAEKALHLHEQELRSLVENTPDTIARYDRECRRIYANPKMLADLGADRGEVMFRKPSEYPGGDSSKAYEERIRQVLNTGEPEDFELSWSGKDGKQVVSYIRLTPEFSTDGDVISVLAVGRDITEIDEYRRSIHHLAFYDTLTKLPNRALLSDRLQQTIADASWHGYMFGLMMLDLDRFKEINDTLGHGVGDTLLREAASRIQECVRIYDTVARMGGDEFAILLPQVRDSADLGNIAHKIVRVFQQPFLIAGKELFASISIGIALYPMDSLEIDALFKYADSAMYHAKKKGRNNFQFYAKELTARSAERMAMDSALRKAEKNEEFALYYQPQVDLRSGAVIGAEALLRWQRQDGELVTPDKFIPVAEETGLIVGIGAWVLHTACTSAVLWNKNLHKPLKIAVNLSTRQFIQNDLVGEVVRILQITGCQPEWLKLEITESLLLEDSAEILAMLQSFDEMGVEISIDDFGTGYSALSYLNRFPVRQIKIDRSFVSGIPVNQEKAELVKAIISIAQALHLDVVAEGIETQEQADYLQLQHCPIGQGYLFGKPVPFNEFFQKSRETS